MDVEAGGVGERREVAEDPVFAEVADCVYDFGPDDELGEAGHEDDEGEVEGEVEAGPELLPPGGEVGCFHPVEVDEEDEVDGGCACGYDTDCRCVCQMMYQVNPGHRRAG